jgi:hypothetical protein
MGGLTRLYIIDAEYYESLEIESEYLYNLVFGSGWEAERISFMQDTGRIAQTEEETDNGTLYNVDISFRIAVLLRGMQTHCLASGEENNNNSLRQ